MAFRLCDGWGGFGGGLGCVGLSGVAWGNKSVTFIAQKTNTFEWHLV